MTPDQDEQARVIAHVGAVALHSIHKLVCEFKLQTDKLIQEGYHQMVVENLQTAMSPIVMGCVVSRHLATMKGCTAEDHEHLEEFLLGMHALMVKHGYSDEIKESTD